MKIVESPVLARRREPTRSQAVYAQIRRRYGSIMGDKQPDTAPGRWRARASILVAALLSLGLIEVGIRRLGTRTDSGRAGGASDQDLAGTPSGAEPSAESIPDDPPVTATGREADEPD